MEIAHQLAELFLGALPTVFIFLLFYSFLRWAFFTPIQKAMAERQALIEGARADAAREDAAARGELDSYKKTLKDALAEIYEEQEDARQAVLSERAQLLRAMRSRSQDEVKEAKKKLAAELAAARTEIDRQTPALASAIARAILEHRSPPPRPGVGP
jgi:F0F1-type ATP synthase membrane subunit b/b'